MIDSTVEAPRVHAVARIRGPIVGLGACLGLAVLARTAAAALGIGIDTALALVAGLAVGLVAPARSLVAAGAAIAARRALRLGIALLGARLTLEHVVNAGASAVVSVVVVVGAALVVGALLAPRFGIESRLARLLTVGMAICGNSAIMALAPIVNAGQRETTYAVSTITLFGLAGVVLLPVAGSALGLSDAAFGQWAGLGVNDTAQVVAAGYAFSSPAGDLATIVKLTRNVAILPVLVGAALLVGRPEAGSTRTAVVRAVPWFVVAFVLVAAARSLGLLDIAVPGAGPLHGVLSAAAGWLILVALAGVGLGADLRGTLRIGARPFALAALLWVGIGALALALALVTNPSIPAS